MAHEFHTQRVVEFVDTDMAGIVHFSNFFRWMESAEHEFFRSFGVLLHEEIDGVMHGYARVSARCGYMAPVKYGERLQVHVVVTHKSERSLGYGFEFRAERGGASTPVARGELRVVCVRKDDEGRIVPTAVPEKVASMLERAPEELRQVFAHD